MEMFKLLNVSVPFLNSKPSHTSEGIGRGFIIAISKTLRRKLMHTNLTSSVLYSCMFDESNNINKESVCSVYLKYLDKENNRYTL